MNRFDNAEFLADYNRSPQGIALRKEFDQFVDDLAKECELTRDELLNQFRDW